MTDDSPKGICMAASDATYRNQKVLHIIFAISSIVMLLTIVGMFAEDYYRDWKVEQRWFRDVEEEMAKRGLLAATPSDKQLDDIVATEQAVAAARKNVENAKKEIEKNHADHLLKMEKTDIQQRGIKADLDSKKSFYDQAVERDPANRAASPAAVKFKAEIDQLNTEYQKITG